MRLADDLIKYPKYWNVTPNLNNLKRTCQLKAQPALHSALVGRGRTSPLPAEYF